MHEPWKVPVLHGRLPAPPKADSDAETKGTYALFCMVLLRPWRDIFLAIQSWIGAPSQFRNHSRDCMWIALYDAYVKWRSELFTSAAPYFSGDSRTWLPAPSFCSDHWWVCVVHRIVESMDMALAHPAQNSTKKPDVQGLPLEEDCDASDMAIVFFEKRFNIG